MVVNVWREATTLFLSICYIFILFQHKRAIRMKDPLRSSYIYPSTFSPYNPLSLPLCLCLTISLSLCSLLKCEMDLSWSLSTWFPREPRESFELDLHWRCCWLLYSTVGTNITVSVLWEICPWVLRKLTQDSKQDTYTSQYRHLKQKQTWAV